MLSNTPRRNCSGTSGLMMPLDVSTHSWQPSISICLTLSAGELTARTQSGQPAFTAANSTNSIGGDWHCTAAAEGPDGEENEVVEQEGGEQESEEHEGGEHEGGEQEGEEQLLGGGLEKVSTTTFRLPAMWCISDTNSAIKASCHRCRSERGSDTLVSAPDSGLWSEKTVKCRPSKRCRKCRMLLYTASSSRSNALYLLSVGLSFCEKNHVAASCPGLSAAAKRRPRGSWTHP
jgi:hypothetical protein